MKRIQRTLFNGLTLLSLLLCIAAAGVWVRGYFVTDFLFWQRTSFREPYTVNILRWGLQTGEGGLAIFFSPTTSESPSAVADFRDEPAAKFLWAKNPFKRPRDPQDDGFLNRWGFRYRYLQFTGNPTETGYSRSGSAPLWSLCVLFGLLPAWWVYSKRRRRRAKQKGHCPHCGYDLRATPDRCPECGAIPTVKA